MLSKFKNFQLLLFIYLLTSCTIYKESEINVLLPPEINTPASVTNILLLDLKGKKIELDSNKIFTFNDKLLRDSSNYDGFVSEAFYDGFYDNMSELLVVDSVYHMQLSDLSDINGLLPWSKVDEMCRLKNSQILVTVGDFEIQTIYDTEFVDQEGVFVDVKTNFKSKWRIYFPYKHIVTDYSKIANHLFYSEQAITERLLMKKIPMRKDLFYDAAYNMSSDYVGKISPTWRNVKRKYFVSGEQRMTAADYFMNNSDFDSAISLWQSILIENNALHSARAALNIALAYEIKKDFINAKAFIAKSLVYYKQCGKKNKEYKYAKSYAEALNSMLELDNQLNVFFDN